MIDKTTIFSPCRRWRYALWRSWPVEEMIVGDNSSETQAHQFVQFIGLNPSTADETRDDPTIRRCIDFAKRWGFGALCMTNLFAFRATDPADMKREPLAAGIDNHHHILRIASQASLVVAAWGVHGIHLNQDLNVRQWVKDAGAKLHHLGLTKDGHPKHLLYLKATTLPQVWNI